MKSLFVMFVALVETETERMNHLAKLLVSPKVLGAAVELHHEVVAAIKVSGIEAAMEKYEAAQAQVGEAGMVFWKALKKGALPEAKPSISVVPPPETVS